MRCLVVLLPTLLAAGSSLGATMADHLPPSWRMAYRCDDGARLTVSFDHAGPDARAWLGEAGHSRALPALAPGAGLRYGDGQTTFTAQGAEARLEDGGAAPRTCRGEGVPQRLLIDRDTGLRLALPASWLPQRYAVQVVRGPEAALLQRDAEVLHALEYQPQDPHLPPRPLLLLAVLPKAAWQDPGRGRAPGRWRVLAMRDSRVYLAGLPQARPYPAGSADAQTFEVMRAGLAEPAARLQQLFSLLGDPEGGLSLRLPVVVKPGVGAPLRAGDRLSLQLLDLSTSEAAARPLARQEQELARAGAARLALSVEADRLQAGQHYLLQARVWRGRRLVHAAQAPLTAAALQDGRPLALPLRPVEGEAAPAEAGLACHGESPHWSLHLTDLAGEARWPGRAPRQLWGVWRHASPGQPPASVWRAAAGPGTAAVVAVLTPVSCELPADDVAGPGTHRALVSLPGGQVLEGCCR
ncbi:YbaY family lipoprotein [Eleftheria terrae]|uniref:YbaY family lipoprotein n=1 Tax=Eleftheria terrae TaxID=1597781 RepID=UPI00263A491E|nr:YbaY family lipoprotein [Eleftheria terrae]WKB51168.1 YbaY family lipoprotein [Eleftheria terrae]